MTYLEYVSQFEILEKQVGREGYHYHHIVPKAIQTEFDDRGILITPAQHLWCHILYDKENGTNTALWFLNRFHKKLNDIHCYEDCLSFNDISEPFKECSHTEETRKKQSENVRAFWTDDKRKEWSERFSGENNPNYGNHALAGYNNPFYGQHHSEEFRSNLSELFKGEGNPWYGFHWYTDGLNNIRAKECPEGYRPGRTLKRIV